MLWLRVLIVGYWSILVLRLVFYRNLFFSKVPIRDELLTETKTTVHTADGTELRTIPAASEIFVEGYVDGKLKVEFGLVESTRYMQSKGPLLAKTLVNVKDEEKCSFYLLNVTQKGVKLGPDSVIGVLSSVDVMDDMQGG